MSKSDQAEKNAKNHKDNKDSKWGQIQSESDSLEDLLFDDIDETAETKPEEESSLSLEEPSLGAVEQKLTEAEQKAHTYWNDKMRLAAEMQNMTRRHEKELTNRAKFGNEEFAKSLLAVLDSCVEGLKLEVDTSNANAKAMHEGLELIAKQLYSVFDKFKIQEMDPIGELFNPECHQAMLAQESDAPEGTIIEVIQKGYQLHERTLRPARVIVAKSRA